MDKIVRSRYKDGLAGPLDSELTENKWEARWSRHIGVRNEQPESCLQAQSCGTQGPRGLFAGKRLIQGDVRD